MRLVHENSLHTSSCFVTLTFSDSNLPKDGSLSVRHLQLFMKDLRNALVRGSAPSPGDAQASPGSFPRGFEDLQPKAASSQAPLGRVRFFACGEYGERLRRPHYHVLLFGFGFPDKVLFKTSSSSSGPIRTYVSSFLSRLWPYGFSLIGDVTFESAAYVARYVTKKITGAMAAKHYGSLKPEFTVMSRRPGIGAGWLAKYGREVYRRDGSSVVVRGREVAPPRFYDSVLEKSDGVAYQHHKAIQRREAARVSKLPDSAPRRLCDRGTAEEGRLKISGGRSYENG